MSEIQGTYWAIDFDGTIIEDGLYPDIGEPLPNVIHTMKRILDEGGNIAIWTARGSMEQAKLITEFLNGHGIYDFIVNDHFPVFLKKFGNPSPKIYADYYIDDRSLHAANGIDWYEIEKMIFGKEERGSK